MTSEQQADLYERLTSRKLWLAMLSIAFGVWNYAEGRLSAIEFQAVVFAAVGVYTVSEGITDAVGAYRPKPASGDVQSVMVGTKAPVATKPPTKRPAATTKRVRPSRAKAKPPEGKG